MISYPRIRVFIAFSLCPSLVAPLFSVWAFLAGVMTPHGEAVSLFLIFGGSIAFGVAAGVSALVFYGIPAVAVSIIYVLCRPFRSWKSISLITMTGAGAAYMWSLFGAPRIEPIPSAAFGAISSLAMALFVLPRKANKMNTCARIDSG